MTATETTPHAMNATRTASNINHILTAPIAEPAAGHVVLGDAAIAANINGRVEYGRLWSDPSQAADADETRFGTRCVFNREWARVVLALRAMPEETARELLATKIDTDRGNTAMADLIVANYRDIYKTGAGAVRILDLDKHDENDIGETKLVRRYLKEAGNTVLEMVAGQSVTA